MVCNIRATREDLISVDQKIQELAAKVAAYRVEIAKWGPVEKEDKRFPGLLEDVRSEANQLTADMAGHQRRAVEHMDDHARAWIDAGMPEVSDDRDSIQAQEQIRAAWRDRIEALGSIVRDLERSKPPIKVPEPVAVDAPVDLAAVIKQALGGRS